MSIIGDKATRHQKNNKAYKLPIALHLQYRIEIKIEDNLIFATCWTQRNKKMQTGILKVRKINYTLAFFG